MSFLLVRGGRRSCDEIVTVLKYIKGDAPRLGLRVGDYTSAISEESAEEIIEIPDAAEILSFFE